MLVAMLICAGCGKKDNVAGSASASTSSTADSLALVKQEERSRHFNAVHEHLEVGGTLYGYVDIDGDVVKIARQLELFAEQIAESQPATAKALKQDYPALVTALGLDGIKALGVSSVPDGTGFFRNKFYAHIPGEKRGIIAGLGGKPAPFARLNLAPADADIYIESEVDMPVVYSTIQQIVDIAAGKEVSGKIEQALKDAGREAAISALSIIQGWKGHMAFVMRLEPQENITLPTPQQFKFPAFSFLISVDGIAPSMRDALVKLPFFAARTEGTLEIFEFRQALPFKGIQPVIVIDGSTLLIATSSQFFGECRATTDRLSGNPEFQTALKHVPNEGNGLLYFSPKFFKRLAEIEGMNPNLPPESARAMGMFMRQMPQTDRPLVSVRSNLPDGLLIESYWNRSMKQDVAGLAVYNPVTVGLLAAMAIPAFNKVRQTSQQKAVLNNLRQLAGASEQFFLETGKSSATYDDLVGPDKYISEIKPIAGESYRGLQFRPGGTLTVRLASGKEVTFER